MGTRLERYDPFFHLVRFSHGLDILEGCCQLFQVLLLMHILSSIDISVA